MDNLHPPPYEANNFYFLINILSGLSIEVALQGLVHVCYRLFVGEEKRDFKFYTVATLLTICNLSTIAYIIANIYISAAESWCHIAGVVDNLASHLLFVSLDAIVLFKCYFITNRNKYSLFCIFLVLTHRIGWMIADLIQSYAYWDDSSFSCVYVQDPLTGIGYTSADIISDIFATMTALIIVFFRFSISSKYIQTMVIRTLLRSVLVVAADGWVLYSNANVTDLMWYNYAWNTQTYVLVRMANLDVLLDLGNLKEAADSNSSGYNSQNYADSEKEKRTLK
ncbi:hypothetical protein BCR33DRAFT_716576 [Rhizoclosmatium globosum]|uniref:G-protein coupled receptors family 1 profile domain-containing protein n=1 Tax=Rhizoclosmatium globosum TaxID=329046 RepID=A0A1Y2CE03_9FUNG|nr:hypothetical protein BCR33DRAFT_716576 [Rhizoclosmatium globosum]|eukprot:ORY45291.1 hypothetical protein BCR33DRAFT_716576 [Rhizoclosmatium globosum]